MGVFDKFLDIMKLNDDDYEEDDFYDDDDYFDDDYEEKPRHKLFGKKNRKEEKYDDFDVEESSDFQPADNKVTPMRPPRETAIWKSVLLNRLLWTTPERSQRLFSQAVQ